MAENVWLVSKGCYSDYRVVAVFTNEAAAQAFAEAANAADASAYDEVVVEDGYVLYDEAPEVHVCYHAEMTVNRDGSVTGHHESTSAKWETHGCRVEVWQHELLEGAFIVEAEGCRKDEVEKAVRDRIDAYRTILI